MIMVMLTRNTGDYLQEKYNAATRVRSTRSGRLKVHRRNLRIPTVIKSMMIMIMMMTMMLVMMMIHKEWSAQSAQEEPEDPNGD